MTEFNSSITGFDLRKIKRESEFIENMAVLGALLAHGEIAGYKITCPHCLETYQIKFSDFNYENEVTCMKCGLSYFQRDNIDGVATRKSLEEYK